MDGGASRSIASKDSKPEPSIYIYLSDNNTSPSVMEGVQCNQSAIGLRGKWCHIGGSVLVSAFVSLDTFQQE